MHITRSMLAVMLGGLLVAGCSSSKGAMTGPSQQQGEQQGQQRPGRGRNGNGGDEIKKYSDVITKDAKSDEGLFTVHQVKDKYYFEIPDSLLERDMLLVSRIAKTVDGFRFGGAGMKARGQQMIRWQRHNDDILLRHVSYESVANDSLPVYKSVRSNNFEPVVYKFDIAAYNEDTTGVVIDVTDFFTTDVPLISGLSNGQRRQFGVRRLDGNRSFISRTRSFPLNIEVWHVLTWEATSPPTEEATNTISLEMNQSMVLLPKEPMMPRLADDRVGYFSVQQADFGSDLQHLDTRRYITRYRLEPKDPAAYARGELVEPVKPIVYYLDPATPYKWRKYLKEGIEDWQPAFEAAGFKNAIIAKDPPSPEEDPDWSPEDIRYSIIRYVANSIPNAQGPHVHDPRSGEILEADVLFYHNVLSVVRNWFFTQTAAVNPDAQGTKFKDEVMGRLLRYVVSHEVGHTLGFPHNMKASSAFPVDSLRSATFTQKYGTTPSIMDYARFNYVAQPGDEGVNLYPPLNGPYDKYAVNWGYRVIPGANSPDDERPTLDGWIREHEDDPMYRFGNPSRYDPSSLTEAIGDDGVKASDYGIQNLKRIVPNLIEWTTEPGHDYGELQTLYGNVIGQWNRYMGHVATIIGGIDLTYRMADQEGTPYTFIPKDQQERALQFIAEQAFQTPTWMLDEDIMSRIEPAGGVERIRSAQARTLDNLLDFSRMARLIEMEARRGDEAYTLGEFLPDIRMAIWSELSDSRPAIDVFRRDLQRAYIERMEYLMTNEMPDNIPAFFRSQLTVLDVSQSDIRPYARGELTTLKADINTALSRTRDQATRYHLQDAVARIDDILDGDD